MAKKKTTTMLTGAVIGGDLNIREEPTKRAKIVGVLPNGTTVNILSPMDDDGWLQITEGYVMSDFIRMNKPVPVPEEAE